MPQAVFSSPDKSLRLVSWLLRIGLAATFLYAAIASLRAPLEWAGFLPSFLTAQFNAQQLTTVFAAYEIGLSLWLLSGWRQRLSGLICALTLLGIIFANPLQLIITFRDFGLFFAALAVTLTAPPRRPA